MFEKIRFTSVDGNQTLQVKDMARGHQGLSRPTRAAPRESGVG